MKNYLPILALAVLLSACGGSGNNGNSSSADGGNTGGTANGGAASASADGFIAKVAALVKTLADGMEPAAVDGVTATAPEDSVPTPII
jgi:hypothetical protein